MVWLAEKAASQGAKLIVFPELATTGYSFMSRQEAEPFAEVPPEGESFRAMVDIAERRGVAIVWGLPIKDPGAGKVYNGQVYVAPGGHFEVYHKINKWGNDYLWADAGRANPPIVHCEVTGKRVGLLICRDVRDKKNDDWNNFYSKGDADIVAFSTNWGDGGFPSVTWMDFVEDHNVALIVSNRYGQETCNNFGEGGTCVIEPSGKVHTDGLEWSQDCIVFADI